MTIALLVANGPVRRLGEIVLYFVFCLAAPVVGLTIRIALEAIGESYALTKVGKVIGHEIFLVFMALLFFVLFGLLIIAIIFNLGSLWNIIRWVFIGYLIFAPIQYAAYKENEAEFWRRWWVNT